VAIPYRSFSPLQFTYFKKKKKVFMGLGSTRTGNSMCRRAVPAGFREISSMPGKMPGGFQYDCQGEIGEIFFLLCALLTDHCL
jgi:hypothetical protein